MLLSSVKRIKLCKDIKTCTFVRNVQNNVLVDALTYNLKLSVKIVLMDTFQLIINVKKNALKDIIIINKIKLVHLV